MLAENNERVKKNTQKTKLQQTPTENYKKHKKLKYTEIPRKTKQAQRTKLQQALRRSEKVIEGLEGLCPLPPDLTNSGLRKVPEAHHPVAPHSRRAPRPLFMAGHGHLPPQSRYTVRSGEHGQHHPKCQ